MNLTVLVKFTSALSLLAALPLSATKWEVSPEQRNQIIAGAVVWKDPGVNALDILSAGPDNHHPTNQPFTCTFNGAAAGEIATTGFSQKFWCHAPGDDVQDKGTKVKYGVENGEVFSEVVTSRLLQALGFFADSVYPVQTTCAQCPEDPWTYLNYRSFITNSCPGDRYRAFCPGETRVPVRVRNISYDPGGGRRLPTRDEKYEAARQYVRWEDQQRPSASRSFFSAVEENYPGKKIYTRGQQDAGVDLSELATVTAASGGSPRAHIDALRLLLAVIKHGDNKFSQQRLVCPKAAVREVNGESVCAEPARIVIQDVGVTFGDNINQLLGVATENNKFDFRAWRSTNVWEDRATCVAELRSGRNATLRNPQISEEGRAFLASLLGRITRPQLIALFTAARVNDRRRVSRGTPEEWADLFLQKAGDVINHHCPH